MPIPFKSPLSSTVANATFLDKTIDDIKTGKLTLRKSDVDPTLIDDVQDFINELADIDGVVGESDPNAKTYSSEQIIANGDDRKAAIGKLDAQAKINLDKNDAQDITLADHESRITTSEGNITTNTGNISSNTSRITDIENDYGTANGLATLDATGKIPSSQLTTDAMELKGQFDPGVDTLTNGVGNNGDYYIVSADGSFDFGAGSISMLTNDIVIYDGNAGVYIVQPGAQVRTVNAQSGDVTLDKTDIGLSNVTNDAQLKRSANDFSTFTEKPTPVDADIVLIEDSEDSGNKKRVQLANLLGGGGAGGSTAWIDGDIAPYQGFTNGLETKDFDNVSGQEMFINVIVPESYTPGDQIKLLNTKLFINDNTNNVLIKCDTTLFKNNDDVTTNVNTHTSTNAELGLGTANVLLNVGEIDISDATGNINGVAVANGDLLVIKLYRDFNNETISSTEDARVLKYSSSVSFTG